MQVCVPNMGQLESGARRFCLGRASHPFFLIVQNDDVFHSNEVTLFRYMVKHCRILNLNDAGHLVL